MESRLARELKLKYAPVAMFFSAEKPAGAVQFAEGSRGCVVALFTAAAKGKVVAFDRNTCGCGGGKVGLGMSEQFAGMPGGIEYFLSTGRGEGYPPGERYLKSPEEARAFFDALPTTDIPFPYIVAKPLSLVGEDETPLQVLFLVNPDQLTALVVMANYGRGGHENVVIPWGAGCHSIGILAYREAQRAHPRAVVGLVDVSARPVVDPDILSFTVPFRMFQEMEGHVAGSFLETESWAKVRARIPQEG